MKNKTQGPVISDARFDDALTADSVPAQDKPGTESQPKASGYQTDKGSKPPVADRIRRILTVGREKLLGDTADSGYTARVHAVRTGLRRGLSVIAVFLLTLLFSGTVLSYETRPLGIAFLCAAALPSHLAASALGNLLTGGDAAVLYLGGMTVALGMRYAVGRFLMPDPDAFGAGHSRRRKQVPRLGARAGRGDAGAPALVRLGRVLFPSGVFSQSIAARVGISVLASTPIAIGYLLGDAVSGEADMTIPAVRAVFLMAAIPIFTYLFCGFFDRTRCTPALHEAGIGAICYAVTASLGGVMLIGFSARQLCAHAITLYISKKHGYLRGALTGLLCGFACDALYAPAFALIGAVSGLLWNVHIAAAVIASAAAGGCYAIYIGAFAAIRTVLPEMIVVSAAAYPLIRYLPGLPGKWGISGALGSDTAETASRPAVPLDDGVPGAEVLGIPSLALQLDTLSGILMGLSSTFYHLSDRTRKPGLYEIRQLCEGISDRYCAHCSCHTLCWEQDFSSTADAMGRITLCIHRKGRAEAGAAFAPLDRRCPNLPNMLAAMNEAAALLCEEKITKDKTETAAGDYEGMAKLLRASAEEHTKSCQRDAVLSRRLGRAMERIGFRADSVSVYGNRRRVVVAEGIDLGGGAAIGEGGGVLGTEELREAFSALSGVRYQPPEYRLSDGGRRLCMTMRAGPKLSVTGGVWGEKKADEEVTGDVACMFANRSDCFYALVCDGMGSGREASVTAQISALFLEKLLSVSTAAGAALNLLNGFLRARPGECSATVDLCEIDMITGEARFIKCGAAASYLLRGEQLFRIASGTMPLGILREVSAQETAFSLCGGDLLLFFSDGVCGEDEESAWISDTVRAAGASYDAMRAKQHIRETVLDGDEANAPEQKREHPTALSPMDALAAALGEAAVARVGRRDDMTVAVLKVREIA
ncbi:MAG: hypothetical protein E7604_13450 [Ruminococcaceae bacterium]|nr:hypothetical protein [Oscillospiraceae bacterium]